MLDARRYSMLLRLRLLSGLPFPMYTPLWESPEEWLSMVLLGSAAIGVLGHAEDVQNSSRRFFDSARMARCPADR